MDTVSCFYDKPEDEQPGIPQRRRYALRDPGQGPRLVLVQYKQPDPGAERRRRGPAARAAQASAGQAAGAAVQVDGAAAGHDGGAAAGEAEASAPAAKRPRLPLAAVPNRPASAKGRQQQQRRRRRQPDFAPAPGVLEDCFAAIVGLLEQAGVPDAVQEVRGRALLPRLGPAPSPPHTPSLSLHSHGPQGASPAHAPQALGDAFERLESDGLEQFVWWARLDECMGRDGGEGAARAFACAAAAQAGAAAPAAAAAACDGT